MRLLCIISLLVLSFTPHVASQSIPTSDPLASFASVNTGNEAAPSAPTLLVHSPDFLLTFNKNRTTTASTSPSSPPLTIPATTTNQCNSLVTSAQQSFAASDYDAAYSHLSKCMKLMVQVMQQASEGEKAKKVDVDTISSLWTHEPFVSWSSLFYYRALSTYKLLTPSSVQLDASLLPSAHADLRQAIDMNDTNPEYWSLESAVFAFEGYGEAALSAGLHQLVLLLQLRPQLDTICTLSPPSSSSSTPSDSDTYSCYYRSLIEYLEKKLEVSITANQPRSTMKLQQVTKVEKAFPKATLQQLVRCLRSLLHVLSQHASLASSTSASSSSSSLHLSQLLSLLLPSDSQLHADTATHLFGVGQPLRAMSHTMHDMTMQLVDVIQPDVEMTLDAAEFNPLHESWTTILRASALLLTAGLETHLTNLARRIMQSRSEAEEVMKMIQLHCKVTACGFTSDMKGVVNLDDPQYPHNNCTSFISSSLLQQLFTSCVITQNVLPTLLSIRASPSHRADLTQTNEFGYSSLHHAALYGEVKIMRALLALAKDADPTVQIAKYLNKMTHYGFTPLHLAVMRGNIPIVKYLLSEHSSVLEFTRRDYSDRDIIDVACIHDFPWNRKALQLILKNEKLPPAMLVGLTGVSATPTKPSRKELKEYCKNVRKMKAKLDYVEPSSVPLASVCHQSGGWSSYLSYNITLTPNPYPCSTLLSAVPKLSLVTPEEEIEHARAMRIARIASGGEKEDDTPIEVSALPTATSPYASLYNTRCTIPILRPPSTYSDFISEIVSLQRPVLIRGGMQWLSTEFSESFYNMQRDLFRKKYGSVRVDSGKIPYAHTFGDEKRELTIEEFLQYMQKMAVKDKVLKRSVMDGKDVESVWQNRTQFNDRSYIFISLPLEEDKSAAASTDGSSTTSTSDPTSPHALLSLFTSPSWLTPPRGDVAVSYTDDGLPLDINGELDPTLHTFAQYRKFQFYLGPRFSGAPEHFHRSAVNLQWFGRKYWKLTPPKFAKYSKRMSIKEYEMEWTEEKERKEMQKMQQQEGDATTPTAKKKSSSASSSQSLHCIQEAGDIVFVPDFWSHSTINLEESIGFAVEMLWGATQFSV